MSLLALERLREEAPNILKKFGPVAQIGKAVEEMAELTVELMKQRDSAKIQEEVADCLIMLYQLRMMYGLTEVDKFIWAKLDRTSKLK